MNSRSLFYRRFAFLFATLLAVTAFSVAQELPTPQQLIQISNTATDLSLTGPYRLHGTVVIFDAGKPLATGHLTIDRDGDNVREEMSFTDYQETAVTTGGKLYLTRKPSVPLRFVQQVRNLDRAWLITLPAASLPGAIRQQKVNNAPALCFDGKLDKQTSARSCFDPASKLAVSNETKGPGGSHTTWFSDYHEFAGKHYPATVHAARGQKAFFDVLEISVKPMQFETGHFTPLPDSLEFRTCRDVQPARLESTVPPEYPPLARGAQLRGTVEVFGIIGTDGKLAQLRALSGHPVLAQAALDTLQRWKYVPASCPDGPVATETKIEIEFGFGPASGPGH